MEVSLRSFRVLGRYYRHSASVTSCRRLAGSVTGTAVQEEVNTELLTTYNTDIKAGKFTYSWQRTEIT